MADNVPVRADSLGGAAGAPGAPPPIFGGMAFLLRALSVAGAALVLTACATTPPPAVTVAPSAGPVSTDAATPTPSGSASPVPSTDASVPADSVVLGPKGVSGADFGAAEAQVAALLTDKAGKADESYTGPVCELDDATPYGRQLQYGQTVFLFQSKAKGSKASPRTFTGWSSDLDAPLNKSLKLADGYPANPSFAALKTAFPAGKQSTIHLGDSSVHVFRTPEGIWYRGYTKKAPDAVGAGPMGTCE